MPKINKNDHGLFGLLVEYRLLTATQLAILTQKSRQGVYRRLAELCHAGLIAARETYGNKKGRPEKAFFLTEAGFKCLGRKDGRSATEFADIDGNSIKHLGHQMLLNRFRVELRKAQERIENMEAIILTYDIGDSIQMDFQDNQRLQFVPDAVFVLKDKVQGRAVLFFLEVDCSTEGIASLRRSRFDLRQKIVNYQVYFSSGGYKKYEQVFGASLNGFRLLVFANTEQRFTAICRLVKEMSSDRLGVDVDFVWTTHQALLFDQGIDTSVWIKGGNTILPKDSILDSFTLGQSQTCVTKE